MIRRQDGFTLIEVVVVAAMLMVGVLTAFAALDSSRRLTTVAERRTSLFQRAQLELERVKSLPYQQIALTGTPASGSPAWSTNSTDWNYASAPTGGCPSTAGGAAPTYQPDHAQGGSTATEPLVINGCAYTISGAATTITKGTVAPSQAWSDGTASGSTYDFITYTNDPTCSQTSTPGSACATTNDYKRITVVVTMTGVAEPAHPAIVSGYIADPNNGQQTSGNPVSTCLTSPTSTTTGPCTNTITKHINQYFACDSSYSASACATPDCKGNTLHNTLVAVGSVAASPDATQTTLPSGSCAGGPPCYATDVLANCSGLPFTTTPPPPSGPACGSSPPLSNSQSHSFVTGGIASGTTLNLDGTGAVTTFLQSNTGTTANVIVCLQLFVVPGGTLGSTSANLLAQPIGAVVSANASVSAAAPTPVSFNFNTGSGATVVGGGALGLPRIEFVIWIAAATGTNVSMVYDQSQAAAQFDLTSS